MMLQDSSVASVVAERYCAIAQCQLGCCSSKQRLIIYLRPITLAVLYICPLSQLNRLPYAFPLFSFSLFSLSLSSPPAVLPSGHSLQLLTETGYVASTEKIKQTSTTNDKQNISLKTAYILRGELQLGEHSKTKKKKPQQNGKNVQSNPFFSRFVFPVIVFSEIL